MAESPSELQAEIEKLERKHTENPEGRYFVPLANAYRKNGDLRRAESLLRDGLRRHPDYLSAHIVLGRCLADRNATREAEDEFRYVLSLDPQNLIALRTLAELALAEGRSSEAERWYGDLLAVDPMNDDARRALEGLSRPGGAEPPEEFQAGAAWWERPAEEREAAPPAPVEPDLQAEPAGWGADTAERPADVAPVEGFDFGGGWIELETESEGEQRAMAEPEAVDREQEPLHGLYADLGDPTVSADDVAGGPEEEGAEEVVTETIAELYARQGFYDRSAEVYRELIRRRGGDAGLELRLAEVEQLAAGEPEPMAGAALADPDELGIERLAGDGLPGAQEPAAEPEVRQDPVGALEGRPATGEGGLPDAFAASFVDGFTALGEEPVMPEAGQTEDEEPEPLPQLVSAADIIAPESLPVAEAAREEPVETPAPAAGPSIAEFLRRLAEWKAGETGVAPQPAPAVLAEPLVVERPEAHTADAWAEAAEPVEAAATEPEPAGGTVPADDELFPWELPAGAGAAEAAEPLEEAPREQQMPEFSLDQVFEQSAPAAPSAPAPAPEQQAPPPVPGAPAPAAEEEDDDLESFQAWLRSLKR